MCNRKMCWVPALLALAVIASVGATARADSSLVGWWPLNEGSGTVAKDASGNGADGALSGDPNWSEDGVDGGCLLFDGTDDYVFIDGHFTLPTYTMAVWFRQDAPGQRDIISAYEVGVRHGILLEVGSDGRVRFLNRFPLGTSGGNSIYSTGSFSDGLWHHAAITKSATEIALYLDGQPAGTMADTSVFDLTDSFGIALGCLDNERGLARQFLGAMDDVRVYNRALSQKEILCAMNNYSIDPVAWYKFDETAGTVAADSVGGRNGTLLPADPEGKGLGPKWVPGKFDGGIQFDGGPGNTNATNDYVELPIGDLISTLSSTTVAAWVNWAGTGGAWQRIFDFGSGTNNYMFLTPSRSGTNSARFAIRTPTVGEQIITAPAILPTDWHHVAITMDSAAMTMQMYVDGAMVRSGATLLLPKDMGVTTQNWIARSQYPDPSYNGIVDDLRIYDRTLSQDEVANAMQGGLGYGVASTPSPADRAVNLLPDVTLSWKAGQLGQTHDVYFGTVADDVANATTADPLNVLVSPGQAATTYDAGRLAFGTTYYWRVDEVGAAPDFTVYKGNVWSFTVEPFGYPMGKAGITATASSSNSADMGPEKTIDGSGLNANDQHSTTETDMWLSAKPGPQPTWVQYAFDKVYSLDKMLVWNSNQMLEAVVGYGAKSVTVESSVDGAEWSPLGEFEFADAGGDPTYTSNTTVDFGGVAAKFVRLTMNSNWGGLLPQYGLSEVRFSYIPVAATNPSPASGTVELEGPVALSWRPGREAASHEVYLGTDQDNLSLVATVFKTGFDATVELDKTYYWQIVEVNQAEPTPRWPSEVWTFKTKELPKDAGVANLVALYAMEDNIDDSSGSGLNGTLTNGPTFIDGPAGMGKALSFDGTDDYATLPIGNLLSTLSDTTIAMWANYSGSGGAWQRMFDFGSGTSAYLFLTPNMASNQMRVALRSTTVGEQIITDGALPTGWHHVAVTIDSATMTMKLYVDGNLKASGTTRLLPKDMGATTQNWLAKSQYSADAYYKGALDDFRIYNRALSKGEVMYLAGQR